VTDDPRAGAAKLGMVLAMWAERIPETRAVISSQGDRTFAEINASANRLVRALRARGVGDEAGIALLCSNRPEFVEVFAASQRMGARLTTINWHLTADEVAYILDDCEAEVFVADARFGGAAIAAAEQAPAATVLVSVGGGIEGFEPYTDVVVDEDPADIDDPVLGTTMLYTSGTTGRPKGVYRDRVAAQSAAVLALQSTSGYKPGVHVHLCTGPLYHAAPLAFSLTAPLSGGAAVVLMDRWDAEETLRLIDEHSITHSHMVPTMFHRLLSLPVEVRDGYDVSSLRFVLHGAAPCPVAVKQELMEWWGPIVHEYYAATEGLGTLVSADQWLERPGTVGRPDPPGQIVVRDDDGTDIPAGEVGTLYLRAPEVGKFSYFKAEQKTREAYAGDGYFTLGDIGYFDEDGWLYLTDRSANLIISGGVNIYPAEVEECLLGHPAVGDVAVIGVPSARDLGEDVLAVVEPQPGVEPTDELGTELLAFTRERLAHFKCPRGVEFTDTLPRADNGKLYKRRIRDEYRSRYERGGSGQT
jgi:long-chain acyl-CoA synthetase